MVAGISDWSNGHLNLLRIDTVILSVRPDKSYVQNSIIVIGVHDEPVFVAADIENNAIAFDKAGVPISAFIEGRYHVPILGSTLESVVSW